MADVAEGLIPPSALDQKGNTTIWWVPTIADPTAPKVTEVGAGTRVTYSFTPAGFNFGGAQGTTKDERLGLIQALESLDTNEVTLDLEYVESTDAKSANVVLAPTPPATTIAGNFVIRTSTPNATLAAAAQKVRVVQVVLGAQNLGTVNNAGKFLIKQKAAIAAVVGPPVALV
ncbi:hypothetical protein [Leifsonia sp. 71-9]|uniref:phage tail tube protein n=1 Tax=Leifsonia sp. 71-9 TaxID=1895934 RepID=UPI00092C27D0|nr:hypothetical protein [Leifsonia sp. 71-9]OJX72830.1 MAG: hypothetical protein BGO91_13760 [Leifsonia sp. 71-9]